jgi:hypothetical protein
MAAKTTWYSRILNEVDPRVLFGTIKYFFSSVFNELEDCKIDQLKDEHKQVFMQLRLDYSQLVNDTLAYCDNTLPSAEYIIECLRKSSTLNLETLRRMTKELSPNQLIDRCNALRMAIMSLNDKIKHDDYYKATGLKRYLRSFLGGLLCVGSLVLVCVMPWALPLEIAILASTGLLFAGTIPSTIQFFKGLTAVQLEKDIVQLSKKLEDAKTHVGNITTKLSDIRKGHNDVCIRLEHADVEDLIRFYEPMVQSIKELRDICHNAIVHF